jgi:hypothetical protein
MLPAITHIKVEQLPILRLKVLFFIIFSLLAAEKNISRNNKDNRMSMNEYAHRKIRTKTYKRFIKKKEFWCLHNSTLEPNDNNDSDGSTMI